MSIVIASVGSAMLLVYCALVYLVLSRFESKIGSTKVYEPPNGLSPASLRFIYKQGYDTTDSRSLVASIVDMAIRGFITIKEEKGDFIITKTDADKSVLTDDEQEIAHLLFRKRNSQSLAYSNHRLINRLSAANVRWMENHYMGEYLRTRTGLIILARIILAATIFSSIGVSGDMKQILCITLLLIFGSIGILFLSGNIRGIIKVCRQYRNWKLVNAVFWRNFTSAMFIFIIFVIVAVVTVKLCQIPPLIILILISMSAIELQFERKMKIPTDAGRELLNRIKAFRNYLMKTDISDVMKMPEISYNISYFERYLPYALALDVEAQWAEKFRDKRSGISPVFIPKWYSGESLIAQDAIAFTTLFAGPVADSISLAYVEPYRH